jgi:HD-like signal output (HDOD) protein
VVAIGAEAVRTLALGLCVLNMFPSKKDSALDHNQFWRHCFGCAVYAEAMMPNWRRSSVQRRLCRLLHDIERVVRDVVPR